MAQQIKGTDIIEDGHLDNAIKQAQELLKVYNELDKAIKRTAEASKQASQGADTNRAKGIQRVNEELKKSEQIKKADLQLDKQKEKLEQRLANLNNEKSKQNALLNEQVRRAAKAQRDQAKATLDGSNAFEKLKRSTNKAQLEFKKLAAQFGVNSKQAQAARKRFEVLDNRLRRINNAARDGRRDVGRYGLALQKAGGALKRFAGAFGLIGGMMLFVRVVRDAFNVIKNFDQANANLASVLGKTREQTAALQEQQKELGSTTKFTAAQVAELQTEYAKLGFTMEQIEGMTEATLQLAAASGTDLGNAAAITGATMRGFGLDVSETQRVVDVMAASFSKSSLDIEKFKVGMAAVAPAANSAGFSIEETTALLGTLTNSGIDASTAGTGLRNIFLELTKKGMSFEDAMSQIANATDQNATALNLFGKRGATLGVILANNQQGAADLTESLENSAGAAGEMADKQLDTLAGALDILRSAWEGIILQFNEGSGAGEGLKETILALAEALPMIVNGITALGKAFPSMSTGMLKNLKIMGDLIKSFQEGTVTFESFGEAVTNLLENTVRSIPFMGQLIDEVKSLGRETNQLSEIQKKNNTVRSKSIEIGNELLKQNEDELGDIPILIDALQDENTTREDKQAIIEKLNEDYPEVIGNIDLETASTEQLIQVKKDLIKALFDQAIAQKKAEVQAEITGQILELELQKIGKNANGVAFLNSQIEELTNGLLLVDDVEAKLRENLGETIEGMNLESPVGKTSQAITELKNEIAGLQDELSRTERGTEEFADLEQRLRRKQEELRRLQGEYTAIIDDGLDREREANDESVKDTKKTGKEKEDLLRKEWEKRKDITKTGFGELKKIEQEFNTAISNNDSLGLSAFLTGAQGIIDKEREAYQKRLAELKRFRDESLAIVKQITDAIVSDIDKRIEARQEEIADADTNISRLQELAAQGNADAAESIKAEKVRVAKEKLEIEALEKRKKNLLISVAFLEKASQNIGSGDGNPFQNALAGLKNSLAQLPTFSEGTVGTVAQALGRTGTTDGHVVRVDDREHILSIKDSETLHAAGLRTNRDIVSAAMASQNNSLARKAITSKGGYVMTDQNIVNELKDVKKAIKGIEITQQHIDILGLKEVIKKGNKTTKNDYNPPTFEI